MELANDESAKSYIIIDYKIQGITRVRHIVTYDKDTDTFIDDFAHYNSTQCQIYSTQHPIVEGVVYNVLQCLPPIRSVPFIDTMDLCDTDIHMTTSGAFDISNNEHHEWQGYLSINDTVLYNITCNLHTTQYNYIYNSLKQLLYTIMRG